MNQIDSLFKFPIVMIDGDNEEKKHRSRQNSLDLGLPGMYEEEDVDIILGEAECPYYDFISITDRWLPTDDSFRRAVKGKFDACFVVFGNSGSFVVPWSKDKFKKELQEFSEEKMDTKDA